MKQSGSIIYLAILPILAGCSSFAQSIYAPSLMREDLPKVRSSANPLNNYYVFDRDNTTLLRAFDDGDRTTLQFADFQTNPPQLFTAQGEPIAYRRIGSYAVLDNLHSRIIVRQNGHLSQVSHPSLPVGYPEYPMLRDDRRLAIRLIDDPHSDNSSDTQLSVRLIAGPTLLNNPAKRGTIDGGILVRPLPRKG